MQLLSGIFILLLLCGPADAARLQATTWADTVVVAATSSSMALNFPVTPTMTEGSLALNVAPLEADISTFSRRADNPVMHTALATNASEFSSLGVVSTFLPSAIPVKDQDAGPDQTGKAANGVASISLMALASLFGIGVIGMGTVGRRRHK